MLQSCHYFPEDLLSIFTQNLVSTQDWDYNEKLHQLLSQVPLPEDSFLQVSCPPHLLIVHQLQLTTNKPFTLEIYLEVEWKLNTT